ncbi:DnaJ domain-containing protein [Breznakia pachnodae]|uniref:DnaJ-class molecular chaperone n=1 Tax=Breznakia pachnodae TaxID=265178 RepID=A0ABU0E658_9FIRM|nr:DnaJ-class molecular chaperone [Breznakia pachnodae]
MAKKDYYLVLGVPKTATADEIKRAYRKLARKYHPDVSTEPDAEAKIKEVNEAYDVLSNPEKKQAYDQYGHAGEQMRQQQHQQQAYGAYGQFTSMDDIFEAFFRASGAQQQQQRQGQGQNYQQRQQYQYQQRRSNPFSFIIQIFIWSFILRLIFSFFFI